MRGRNRSARLTQEEEVITASNFVLSLRKQRVYLWSESKLHTLFFYELKRNQRSSPAP